MSTTISLPSITELTQHNKWKPSFVAFLSSKKLGMVVKPGFQPPSIQHPSFFPPVLGAPLMNAVGTANGHTRAEFREMNTQYEQMQEESYGYMVLATQDFPTLNDHLRRHPLLLQNVQPPNLPPPLHGSVLFAIIEEFCNNNQSEAIASHLLTSETCFIQAALSRLNNDAI